MLTLATASKLDLLRVRPGEPLLPPRRWPGEPLRELGEPLRECGDDDRPKTSLSTRSSKSSPSALSKGVCTRDGSVLVSERRLASECERRLANDCDRDCDERDCARDCTRDGSADSPLCRRSCRSTVGNFAAQLRGRSLGGSGRRFVSVRRRSIRVVSSPRTAGVLFSCNQARARQAFEGSNEGVRGV